MSTHTASAAFAAANKLNQNEHFPAINSPPAHKFANAIYSADSSVPMPIEIDGVLTQITDLKDVPETGELRASPQTMSGVAFVFDVYKGDKAFPIEPTAIIRKEDTSLAFFVFEKLVAPEDAKPFADFFGMQSVDELAPVPTGGWSLVDAEANRYYALEAMATAFPETKPPMYGDAIVMTPYDENLHTDPITITLGACVDSKNWNPKPMPRNKFIAQLCKHIEGTKDGPAFVFADMVPGQRLKTSVKAETGIGLDLDVGTPPAQIDAALAKLNCLAIRYTTHSDGRTTTEFKKDKIVKFIATQGPGKELEDDETIRWFLKESENWDPAVVASATYGGTDHTNKGIVVSVEHMPMPKNRVIIPLKHPFEIAKEGDTQAEAMKKWAKVPTALADMLGLPLDKTGTDPSRLFYFPRHAKGREFEVALFGGPDLFDWKTLVLEDPLEAFVEDLKKTNKTSKSVTEEGRALGRWSVKRAHGFQIADVVEDHAVDRLRGSASQGFNVECPFDENHGNAGDIEDKACFIVNAGMGMSEIFTISCRHESCRDKTPLDMLGKMVKDGWFTKDVLEDEQYNAIIDDETQPAAAKIEKQDNARASYEISIEALTPASRETAIRPVIAMLADANLSDFDNDMVLESICTMTKKRAMSKFRLMLLCAQREKAEKESQNKSKEVRRTAKGVAVFEYQGEYNFDDAYQFCRDEMLVHNKNGGYPSLCRIDVEPVGMNFVGDHGVSFDSLTEKRYRAAESQAVTFVRASEKGGSGARGKVPNEISEHNYYRARDWLPEAPAVCAAPSFLPNGVLLTEPGYHLDPENGINHYMNYADAAKFAIPDVPTIEDVRASVKWLRDEVFGDFAFCDFTTDEKGNSAPKETREAGEANAFAILLTQPIRPLLSSTAISPLILIQKPETGEGATLLAQVPGLLYDGVPTDTLRASDNEEEISKGIISAVRQKFSTLFYDDALDLNKKEYHRLGTALKVSGRLLGGNTIISVPNKFLTIFTGKNPSVNAESARRIVPVRLNSKLPKGTQRKYRHPEIIEYLKTNRAVAVGHLLTMIRYWHQNGAKSGSRTMDSYADWAAKVGGVLEVCEINGFLAHKPMSSHDPEAAALNEFAKASVQKFQGDLVSYDVLLNFHVEKDSGILSGVKEADRKAHFMARLCKIAGCTFRLDHGNFLFRLTEKNGEFFFHFERQKGDEDKAEGLPNG